jgi:hypothetical protein
VTPGASRANKGTCRSSFPTFVNCSAAPDPKADLATFIEGIVT